MNPTAIDLAILGFLLKGAAFAALAFAAGLILTKRMSARASSLYWRTTLVGMLALPLVALFLPVLPLLKSAESTSLPAAVVAPTTEEWRVSYPDSESTALTAPAASVALESTSESANQTPFSWLALLWAGGAALVVLRWSRARLKLRRLSRRAVALTGEEWTEPITELGMSPSQLRILQSDEISLPMVWGSLRPVLMLPADTDQWDAATKRSVLAHELAHVRRRDALFLLLSTLAVALHWINPLAWLATKRLRLTDERSADDSVLAGGGEAASYASLLLDFARRSPAPGRGLPVAAPSMAHRSTVGERVERLLDEKQHRGAPKLRHWLGGSVATLCCAFVIGALCNKEAVAQAPAAPVGETDGVKVIKTKLDKIILPKVEFSDATLEEAVEFLRIRSRELDTEEADPARKGVNIVIDAKAKQDASITMKLTNVPLGVVLEYTSKLAGGAYKITPHAVVITPKSAADGDQLFTRTFKVPPDFLNRLGAGGPDDDPFADQNPVRRIGIKEMLKDKGIDFPEGASVLYNPKLSSLVVRNTQANMDLLETLIAVTDQNRPSVLRLRVEFYEMQKETALEIIKAADSQPAADAATALLKKLVGAGEVKLLSSPSLITRSGQRAKIESGEKLEYVSGYVGKDGKDVPKMKSVLIGTSVECDPVVGADGNTLDIAIAVSMARGEPKVTKRKIVGPASGLEREVESVAINEGKLTLAFTTLSGQTQLIGNLQADKVDAPTAVLAFVTTTVTKVKAE